MKKSDNYFSKSYDLKTAKTSQLIKNEDNKISRLVLHRTSKRICVDKSSVPRVKSFKFNFNSAVTNKKQLKLNVNKESINHTLIQGGYNISPYSSNSGASSYSELSNFNIPDNSKKRSDKNIHSENSRSGLKKEFSDINSRIRIPGNISGESKILNKPLSSYTLKSETEGVKGLKKAVFTVDDYINARKKVTIEYNPNGKNEKKGIKSLTDKAAKHKQSDYRPRVIWSKNSTKKDNGTVTITTKQIGHFKKVEIMDADKYAKMVDPTFSGRMRRSVENHLKEGLVRLENFPKNMVLKGTHKLNDSFQNRLNNEGLGGQLASQTLSVPRYAKNVYHSGRYGIKGIKSFGKISWNTARATTEGSINLYRSSKETAKKFIKFKKSNPTVGQWVKGAGNVAKSISEKTGQVVAKVLKSAVTKLLSFLPACGGGIILLIVMLICGILVIIGGSDAAIPLGDSNTIISYKNFCDNLEDQWYGMLDSIKESFEINKYECGYSDSCNIHIQSNGDDTIVADTWLHLYVLSLAHFNYDVGLMGVPYGNSLDDGTIPINVIESWLEDTFDMMYPSDLTKMRVEQETLTHTETDDETGELTHEHTYIKTDVYVEIMTFEEALNEMEWHTNTTHFCQRTIDDWYSLDYTMQQEISSTIGAEKDHEVKEYYNELIIEISTNTGEEWKSQVGVSVAGNYDTLSSDEIEALLENAPVINMTRQEFVNFVSGYCIPTGKIPYFWGGRSAPGWNSSWGELRLVTAEGSSKTNTYQRYGLDCSGFVSWIFSTAGQNLFGSAYTGAIWSMTVPISESDAKPGDLVFKQLPSSGGINHIGIYLGNYSSNGKFAHCSSSAGGTTVNDYSGFIFYRRPIVKFLDD